MPASNTVITISTSKPIAAEQLSWLGIDDAQPGSDVPGSDFERALERVNCSIPGLAAFQPIGFNKQQLAKDILCRCLADESSRQFAARHLGVSACFGMNLLSLQTDLAKKKYIIECKPVSLCVEKFDRENNSMEVTLITHLWKKEGDRVSWVAAVTGKYSFSKQDERNQLQLMSYELDIRDPGFMTMIADTQYMHELAGQGIKVALDNEQLKTAYYERALTDRKSVTSVVSASLVVGLMLGGFFLASSLLAQSLIVIATIACLIMTHEYNKHHCRKTAEQKTQDMHASMSQIQTPNRPSSSLQSHLMASGKRPEPGLLATGTSTFCGAPVAVTMDRDGRQGAQTSSMIAPCCTSCLR